MNQRYDNMLRFLKHDFVNLKLVNKNAEELINLAGYLNALITAPQGEEDGVVNGLKR
jgi:hypothetical protein